MLNAVRLLTQPIYTKQKKHHAHQFANILRVSSHFQPVYSISFLAQVLTLCIKQSKDQEGFVKEDAVPMMLEVKFCF